MFSTIFLNPKCVSILLFHLRTTEVKGTLEHPHLLCTKSEFRTSTPQVLPLYRSRELVLTCYWSLSREKGGVSKYSTSLTTDKCPLRICTLDTLLEKSLGLSQGPFRKTRIIYSSVYLVIPTATSTSILSSVI